MKTVKQNLIPAAFLFALVVFVLPVCVNAQTIKNDWIGNYELFDAKRAGPKNQPNNFVTYTLTISKNGNRPAARFTADGTQISDDYECRVEADNDSLKLIFVKDLGGTEEGKAALLKNGDLIFTLTKTAAGRKTRYLFRTGRYEIFPLSLKTRSISAKSNDLQLFRRNYVPKS